MTLNNISAKLTSEILSTLQVRDWIRLTPELNTIVTVALSKMYIKGRNHERDSIDWSFIGNNIVHTDK